MTAEILAQAGLAVVIVEEGPLKSSADFRMREREAYPQLYQESAGRQTRDKAITILQGRCVGGSTTVNWTSSFRTPPRTLAHWRDAHGLAARGRGRRSRRGSRAWRSGSRSRPWPVPPNENNDILRRGCEKLGIPAAAIRRNVKGCWNLGYCGMGCPTNAKQSMLVTTIPAALDRGRDARAPRARRAARRVAATGSRPPRRAAWRGSGAPPGPHRIRLAARHFVLAAGAIGSPAVLLRSGLPDPHALVGRRTFLHPTVVSAAVMPEPVRGLRRRAADDLLGPLPRHGPGRRAGRLQARGAAAAPDPRGHHAARASATGHARWMKEFANLQVVIALLRDGFHPGSPGGRVRLRADGSPELDYPIGEFLLGRHAPRLPHDGRDPVRGGREDR